MSWCFNFSHNTYCISLQTYTKMYSILYILAVQDCLFAPVLFGWKFSYDASRSCINTNIYYLSCTQWKGICRTMCRNTHCRLKVCNWWLLAFFHDGAISFLLAPTRIFSLLLAQSQFCNRVQIFTLLCRLKATFLTYRMFSQYLSTKEKCSQLQKQILKKTTVQHV